MMFLFGLIGEAALYQKYEDELSFLIALPLSMWLALLCLLRLALRPEPSLEKSP